MIFPILYVLSIGPAVRLEHEGELSYSASKAAVSFYAPLGHLEKLWPSMQNAVRSYVSLWTPYHADLCSLPFLQFQLELQELNTPSGFGASPALPFTSSPR